MGTRVGGRSRKQQQQQQEMMRWCQQQQQQQQTLTPLMEGPHECDQYQQLEMQLHDLLLVGNKKEISSWEVVREWFRLHKNNMAPVGGGGGGGGGGRSTIPASKRQDLRLLLGVLGCPLAPIPLDHLLLPPPPTTTTTNNHNTPTLLPHNHPLLTQLPLHHLPIESSTAHYIIQQYLAATGCLKKQQQQQRITTSSSSNNNKLSSSSSSRKNMYTAGTLRMICCETEMSCGKSVKTVGSRSGEKGCFVLWQMYPGMWSLELVVAGHKVLAGSDGKIVWRHVPWLGTHAAKGPQRPLRRIIQGLDPKSTARLFGRAECMGEKRIGNEDCFVLKVAAERADVMERNDGRAEVIRHVLYGYFSQKSGLLIYMEDSHLTRVLQSDDHDHHHESGNYDDDDDSDEQHHYHHHHHHHHHHVYWETTIGSSIGDYRDVDGLLIAHQGRTIATVFRFGEMSTQHTRTRMEEHWCIDDVVFDVPGLDTHSFIPPADIFHH